MELLPEQQCDWPWQQLPEQAWWQVVHLPIYLHTTVEGMAQTLAEEEAVLLACTCARLKPCSQGCAGQPQSPAAGHWCHNSLCAKPQQELCNCS